MKSYRKNYAPKSRQEVAGGNDHCWIPEAMKQPTDRAKFDRNCERAFGKKSLNIWPRDKNGNLIDD